jgi:hypothetical protein
MKHPDCTLDPAECRIVKTESTIAPTTPPIYDGADTLLSDTTTYVVENTCGTCARVWQERTVGGETTLVNLPPAADPPMNVDIPYAQQEAGELTCTMGNWTGEPTRYSFQWVKEGTTIVGSGERFVFPADVVGAVVTCIVSATNAHGTTAAPPSNPVTVEAPVEAPEALPPAA